MTEPDYFEQAERDDLTLEQIRADFMADTEPVTETDACKLVEIAEKLRNEDTSLNIYELYKHPEARAKLFAQVTEACYMLLKVEPTQSDRLEFGEYLEDKFRATMKKLIDQTNRQAVAELIESLEISPEHQEQFAKDLAVSGLVSN